MFKKTLLLLLVLGASAVYGQTIVQLSNVRIKDGPDVRTGNTLSVQLNRAEGKDDAVLYADQNMELKVHFKVTTHNVRRSSTKDGAVNLMMVMRMSAYGKKDKRQTEKIFYMDQERTTTFNEKFVIKQGIDVRKIEVSFDAAIK